MPEGTTFREYAGLISDISTGLSDADLALADATPEDVTTGKTFYAGNRTLKTGTRTNVRVMFGTMTQDEIITCEGSIIFAAILTSTGRAAAVNRTSTQCTVGGSYSYYGFLRLDTAAN